MGAKKAKRRKPLSSNRGLSDSATIPVYEGEILLTYRLPTEPHDQAVFLHAMLNKYMFIEGGRMLGRRTPNGGFETVLGFVDQKSVNRTMENISTSLKIDLDKWAVAPGSESVAKLEPIGQFLDEEDNHTIASILASDPDAIQANQEGIAERMDKEGRNQDGRFIFPDLSEEEYNAIRANRNRKPN